MDKRKKIFFQDGVTLLEMVVAVGMFAVVMILAVGIFKSVVESQRSAISAQNIQESMRYAFELMSREIRTAKGRHEGSDCGPIGFPGYFKVFNTNGGAGSEDDGNALYFENKNGDCVIYATTTNNQIEITRVKDQGAGATKQMVMSPDEVEIKDFSFFVVDDLADAFHSKQARVTFNIEAEIRGGKEMHKQNIKMQTTVSSRYYE